MLTAIGCVPGAGDVIKSIGKAIIKGADDITITLLKKLDAEDILTAFVKFRQTLQASTEEAVATINGWLKKAENQYKETELAELLSIANECMNKAVDFVHAKVDEFGWKVFGEGNVPDETKLLEKRDREKTIITKEFTSNPFQDDGKLKPNIKYAAGEHNYYYETDELGRICKCSADELKLKEHLGRLKHNPNTPGKLEGDHAGHLVADVFGGSPELDNLVSQAKDVNFKQYRDIERAWEKALKKIPPDEITDLKIEIIYDGNSVRPKEFRIKYCINGKPYEPDAIPNV